MTNWGGRELRQAPTEIGCCLCMIMLLWEPQWVCFLHSLLKSFALFGFSPSTDTAPPWNGEWRGWDRELYSHRKSFLFQPIQPRARLELWRRSLGHQVVPLWLEGMSELSQKCILQSPVGPFWSREVLSLLCPHLITIKRKVTVTLRHIKIIVILSFGVICCYTAKDHPNTHLLRF